MKRRRASAARLAVTASILALWAGACEGRRTLTLFPEAAGGSDAGSGSGGRDSPPLVRCGSDRDCPEELPSCDDDDDRCVECGPSVRCPDGFVCFLEDRVCEPVCNGPADCGGERPYCDVASGRCVQCLVHANCPTWEPRCESVTGRCGDCATNEDCGGLLCRPRDLECVECLDRRDCGDDEECDRGQCRR